jgi:hypothetical protein
MTQHILCRPTTRPATADPTPARPGRYPWTTVRDLLIGGLITLTVTAIVQILVVPRVHQQNQRLERWEKDILELRAIVMERVPRALANLFYSGYGPLIIYGARQEGVEFAPEKS